ncbi:MAG: hypothetical protein IRZ07_23565 [Microbispora sp.]|nr:hypothetical protein [Microbispora sp.]
MPNTSDPDHLLATILPFAVAMEIHRMADLDPATRTRFITAHAPHSADLVGSQADQLLQGGHDIPQTFAALARGIACLAHAPRGVTVYGRHYCTNHDHCTSEDTTDVSPHTRRLLAQIGATNA